MPTQNKNTKAYGTESFAMGLHKSQGNLEVAQKENSVIILEKDYNTKYEGFDPNSAESYIIFSMMQNMFLEKSLKIASMVQNEFKDRANRFDRGVKQAGFLVLWHTKMPSVLIETGFISNPEEELFLNSASGQDYLASAIYRAIKKFLDETENESKELDNEIIMQKETQVESQLIQNSGLIYRVQVTSSSKKMEITDSYFKNYQDIYEYVEGDTYKYTLDHSVNYRR
jgi:N-acetylmuramoyl-L-alanine amidase